MVTAGKVKAIRDRKLTEAETRQEEKEIKALKEREKILDIMINYHRVRRSSGRIT